MDFKPQRIRDPLHNLINFPRDTFDEAMWRVIQTSEFQRLRRIKQLGFSELVYPGATHTRFAHSLGVFDTARKLLTVVAECLGKSVYDPNKAQRALAAALVHDLGHGSYSHAFEEVGKRLNLPMAKHEKVTDMLIREGNISVALNELGSGFSSDVADIIKKSGPANVYGAVVSSQFDADRLDYMQRDRLMTGTHHGMIDFDWLLSNLEIGKVPYGADDESVGEIETFVLGPKAIYAAEGYLLGLFQLYATVYFHKTTRGAEKLFTELLVQIIKLAQDGSISRTGLSANHPIIRFAKQPNDLQSILALDDSVIGGAFSMMASSKDPLISDFSNRLRNRNLFKCVDIRERLNQKLGSKASAKSNNSKNSKALIPCKSAAKQRNSVTEDEWKINALDKTCYAVEKRLLEFQKGKNLEKPQLLEDKPPERSIYKPFEESKGPLNQIMIWPGFGDDKPIDVASISQVIKAIAPFRAFRVYMNDGDQKTKVAVDQIIEEEVKRCRC